jgi:hypothetical protein
MLKGRMNMKALSNWQNRIVFAVLAFVLMAGLNAARADSVTINFDAAHVAPRQWIGYGINWIDSSAEQFPLDTARLAQMQPGFVRINWRQQMIIPSGKLGEYDWNTTYARDMFRMFDYCKEHHIPVLTGTWTVPPADTFVSPAYAQFNADLMRQLVVTRGYTNIMAYAGVNEPNLEQKLSYEQWKLWLANTRAAFSKAGLDGKVALAGPEVAGSVRAESWLSGLGSEPAVRGALGLYDWHFYPAAVEGDNMERRFKDGVATVGAEKADGQSIVLGEMGINHPDRNPEVPTFDYGLRMADYGVQLARAGVSGAAAWCLHSPRKNCGMWDIPRNDTTIRPWYYSWSMLARFVRPGSTIYRPEIKVSNLRVIAAQLGSKGSENWTVVLVNLGKTAMDTKLQGPAQSKRKFSEYLYADGKIPTDNTGAFAPAASLEGSLASGIAVNVPAHSMVVLTTYESSGR